MPKEKLQTRWFTAENKNGKKGAGGKLKFGRKGSPAIVLNSHSTVEIANIIGSGTINRMWLVFWKRDIKALRGIKLEIYWDNADKPAVQVPVGDFFCQSLGVMSTFENFFFSSPEGRSFNCFIPMPFKKSAKILLINESDENNFIYYDVDCTLNKNHNENMLYFHSYWRRDSKMKTRQDFSILPKINGYGKFLGCHIQAITNPKLDFWWGEGEIKIYLDGDDKYPTLCGTGTEDYIGTGYGQGKFINLYQGNQYISKDEKRYGFYRFHIPDPIYFYENIKVDIQVMGGGTFSQFLKTLNQNPALKLMKTGDGKQFYSREELEKFPNNSNTVERQDDDYCAVAYWYLNAPTNNLPKISDYKERIAGLQ